MSFNVNDIINLTFDKLTVISFAYKKQVLNKGKKNGYKYFYNCKCICGNSCIVERRHLINSHTRSCGCLTMKHNKTSTRLFRIWAGIKQRCYNVNREKYKNYGAKGITMCEDWKNNFNCFYNWATSNGYNDNLTIDRIDVNGNYEPKNCQWVNQQKQQNNRTNNHILEFNNQSYTINEWARITNIKRCTIKERLKRGWSIEKTLTTQVRNFRNLKQLDIQ